MVLSELVSELLEKEMSSYTSYVNGYVRQ